MTAFLVRRLAVSLPLMLAAVSFLTFVLLRLAPGDFFSQREMDPSYALRDVLAQKAQAGLLKPVTGDALAAVGELPAPGFVSDGAGTIYREIGPLEGYLRWLGGAARLDFGVSYKFNRPVWGLIRERTWNTLKLSLAALVVSWGAAIPLGVLAAVRPHQRFDHAASLLAFLGLSVPSVFLALLAVLFASYTGWFPVGDMRDVVDGDSLSGAGRILDELHHLALPALVVGTGTMAGYMRQTRGNMLETLAQAYIRTARGKGLKPRTVLFKHALRNALNPLVTQFGYALASLLSGSFLVEVVMNWPGLARVTVDAVFARDEPVVLAAVLMGSVLLVLGNLLADVLLKLVDPRITLA